MESCRKVDLFLVADFYDISVVKTAKKKEVRDLIYDSLVQQGVLQPRPAGAAQNVDAGANSHATDDSMLHSPSGTNLDDLKLAIQLKQSDLEIKRQEHTTQLLRFRQCELETQADRRSPVLPPKLSPIPTVSPSASFAVNSNPTPVNSLPVSSNNYADFDISRHITLVPPFRDNEVDSYFGAFERIAAALRRPKETWSLLIQCKLTGKAQEVSSALSVNDSLDYDKLKNAVLKAYELVPEAYRQKFRLHSKGSSQTFVEYAREKSMLFDKWCHSSKVTDFEQLRELILIEDFKNSLPDKIVVFLNEKKISTLAEAAVCADEFVLTHKSTFVSRRESNFSPVFEKNGKASKSLKQVKTAESRECFYCHDLGHLISMCPILRKKNQVKAAKSVGFVSRESKPDLDIDALYDPFVCQGTISLSGLAQDSVPVTILRDTGSVQSFVLFDSLHFSDESYCGSDVLIQGIELGVLKVPLHKVYIQSDLVTGFVKLAVRHQLPVKGVAVIIGNDLAGGKVLPYPEVIENPLCETVNSNDLVSEFPTVFSACVITRAQARKFGDMIDLSDTFIGSSQDMTLETQGADSLSTTCGAESLSNDLPLSADKVLISVEQKNDSSLSRCRTTALTAEAIKNKPIGYFWDDDVLKRKWTPTVSDGLGWDVVFQLVVPKCLRRQVLSVAHDNVAGHLGIFFLAWNESRRCKILSFMSHMPGCGKT